MIYRPRRTDGKPDISISAADSKALKREFQRSMSKLEEFARLSAEYHAREHRRRLWRAFWRGFCNPFGFPWRRR